MQIVKYEINKNILTIGYKENNFVVYSQIVYDATKTKEELLQNAYIQCRNAIEYEETQTEHSLLTEEKGEEFIPEQSKTVKLVADFNNFTGKVLDQYGETISANTIFTIEGANKAKIENGKIVEQPVIADTEYFIVAKCGDFIEKQKRVIYAPKVVQPQVSENEIQLASFILDTTSRIENIEKKINGGV